MWKIFYGFWWGKFGNIIIRLTRSHTIIDNNCLDLWILGSYRKLSPWPFELRATTLKVKSKLPFINQYSTLNGLFLYKHNVKYWFSALRLICFSLQLGAKYNIVTSIVLEGFQFETPYLVEQKLFLAKLYVWCGIIALKVELIGVVIV